MWSDRVSVDADELGEMSVIICEYLNTVRRMVYNNTYLEVMGEKAEVAAMFDEFYRWGNLEGRLVAGKAIARYDYDKVYELEKVLVTIQTRYSELYPEPSQEVLDQRITDEDEDFSEYTPESHVFFAYDASEEFAEPEEQIFTDQENNLYIVTQGDYLDSLGWEPEPHDC